MNAFLTDWRGNPQMSLHQLTALDAPPLALIDMAHALGCTSVCIFTHVPEAARHIYPMVGPDTLDAVKALLARTGLAISNLEVFPLDGKTALQDFFPGLATGAALGARRVTAHIHEAEPQDAVPRFAAFCDLAASYGLDAGLEFNAFSAVKDIGTAEHIIRAAARPNARLVLDLLHLMRSGGTIEDVVRTADLIDFVQLCDGPASIAEDQRWREAVGERGLPGTGSFPLTALLGQLRPGTLIDIEVPQSAARKAGVPAPDRASAAVTAARALLQGS